MRTTLDIDRELLDEAVDRLGVRSKREAVETALREAVDLRKRRSLQQLLGSFDLDLTVEELERLRAEP
jgi:Arc/MetJ family transcription regulator